MPIKMEVFSLHHGKINGVPWKPQGSQGDHGNFRHRVAEAIEDREVDLVKIGIKVLRISSHLPGKFLWISIREHIAKTLS